VNAIEFQPGRRVHVLCRVKAVFQLGKESSEVMVGVVIVPSSLTTTSHQDSWRETHIVIRSNWQTTLCHQILRENTVFRIRDGLCVGTSDLSIGTPTSNDWSLDPACNIILDEYAQLEIPTTQPPPIDQGLLTIIEFVIVIFFEYLYTVYVLSCLAPYRCVRFRLRSSIPPSSSGISLITGKFVIDEGFCTRWR
jgi:hypothetical protein